MASNGAFYSNTSGLNLNTSTTTRINISTSGAITFNQDYTFPTADGGANEVLITDGAGNLNFSTVPNAGLTNSSLTITAGSGLANGGLVSLGGSVTLNVGAGTGIVVNANDVALDYAGTNNFIDSATNLEGTSISASDTIVYHDATDNNVKKGLVSDLPFSNNDGTVTSVGITAGALIDVSNSPITTSGNITVAVDLSELTTSTTNGDGDFFAVIDSSNVQRKLTKGSIDISGFNNDAGYTTNTGTVTSVAISGTDGIDVDSGSPITGSGTITLGLSNVPNSVLSNSSFTVNAPSGTDPVIPLGGTLNFTSSDNSVTIGGNSTTDTIDLTVAAGVDTFVTGGTFTSGTLSLGLNDGTSAQNISGFWSSIPNSALANSAITIAGTSVSLGGSISGDDIIADVSAGQITNSQLVNSSLTVTAGSGLANGGSVSLGGSVTLNVGAGTGIQVNANDVALDYAGTNNFIDSATNLEGTGIATSDTIVYHDATDNNVKKGLVSDLPFSNNSGTVTSVGITAGALIDVSNSPITTSGNITVAVDLSELSTSTTNGDGDFFAVVDASNVQRKLTKGNINISGFNNDAGYTTNTGTVTSVAISGTDGIDVDSGSPITTSGTITLGLSNVPNSSLANSSVTVNGGDGLTGGGLVSLGGSVTLNVGAGTLIDVDGSNVNVDLSELATSTSNGDGDYFVVVDTANAQKKLTKGNINISGFNNDAGYITSAGNTNIYNINGTLSGARELNQNGNNLRFRGTSNEEFQVYKSNATAVQVPRVRFETDDTHTSVLELQSSVPSTFLIDAYDAGNAPIFNVDGNGNLFAVSKSFLIEHPSKEGFNLRHGSLEGPEHGVYVRGKLDGNNTIELPDYWLDLVDEDTITVQLTPIGSHQNLYIKDIIDNTVIVANSALLSSKIKCFYFVQAERKDIDKMVVEYPRETPTI
jgi:hypothetical protein